MKIKSVLIQIFIFDLNHEHTLQVSTMVVKVMVLLGSSCCISISIIMTLCIQHADYISKSNN